MSASDSLGRCRIIGMAVGAAALVSLGCGEGRHLAPSEAKRLPTFLGNAGEEVCVRPADPGLDPPVHETRPSGERKVASLVEVYKREPKAVVTVSYGTSDDPGPAIQEDEVTIEELVMETLKDLENDGCSPELQQELRQLL